jgi:hypothetical protein
VLVEESHFHSQYVLDLQLREILILPSWNCLGIHNLLLLLINLASHSAQTFFTHILSRVPFIVSQFVLLFAASQAIDLRVKFNYDLTRSSVNTENGRKCYIIGFLKQNLLYSYLLVVALR